MHTHTVRGTCTHCGSDFKVSKGDTVYCVDPHIVLSELTVIQCKCVKGMVTIPKLSRLNHRIANLLISKQSRLTGGELRFLRAHMRISEEQLAWSLNISMAKFFAYEKNDESIPRDTDMRCRRFAARKCSLGIPDVDSGLGDMPGRTMSAVMAYIDGVWQPLRAH